MLFVQRKEVIEQCRVEIQTGVQHTEVCVGPRLLVVQFVEQRIELPLSRLICNHFNSSLEVGVNSRSLVTRWSLGNRWNSSLRSRLNSWGSSRGLDCVVIWRTIRATLVVTVGPRLPECKRPRENKENELKRCSKFKNIHRDRTPCRTARDGPPHCLMWKNVCEK